MVNAFRAGTIVAVVAGGRRLVHGAAPPELRGPHPGRGVVPGGRRRHLAGGQRHRSATSPGASPPPLVIALVPRSGSGAASSEESAVIGTVQAFALACGVLFVSLYGGFLDSLTGLLFGTFLGVSDGQVVALAAGGRWRCWPCWPSSADPSSSPPSTPTWPPPAGCRCGRLSVVFLVLLGCTAAEVSQITGALLVFALLVMPAAAAQQLTARPALEPGGLTVAIGLVVTWLALAVAYFSVYPVGFFVTTFGFAAYLLAAGDRVACPRPVGGSRPPGAPPRRRCRRDGAGRIPSPGSPTCSATRSSGTPSWPARHRPGLGPGRLLRGPARPGLHRRRPVPRGLHRGAGRPGLRDRPPGRPLRRLRRRSPCCWPSSGRRARADDTVIGSVFAWILGLGALFLSIYTTSRSGTGG